MKKSKCVCASCEYGPDKSEVPTCPSWHADVFCSIGDIIVDVDSGEERSIAGFVKPWFADVQDPSLCPKMVRHKQRLAARIHSLVHNAA